MTSEDGSGLMKWGYRAIIFGIIIFVLFILGLFQSCGARKSQVEIAKSKVEEKSQGKEESKESSQTESSTESKSKDSTDKSEEIYTKRIEELYSENGQLIKRITELSNQKSTDKSVNTKSSSETLKTFKYKTWIKTYWKTITIRTKEKTKATEANNNALYICIAFLGGLVILLGYLYYSARSKLRNEVGVLG